MIVPGERYEVLVDFPDPAGTELFLQTEYYDRGHDIPDTGPQRVLELQVTDSESNVGELPQTWGSAPDLEPPAAAMQRELELSEATPEDGKHGPASNEAHCMPLAAAGTAGSGHTGH